MICLREKFVFSIGPSLWKLEERSVAITFVTLGEHAPFEAPPSRISPLLSHPTIRRVLLPSSPLHDSSRTRERDAHEEYEPCVNMRHACGATKQENDTKHMPPSCTLFLLSPLESGQSHNTDLRL